MERCLAQAAARVSEQQIHASGLGGHVVLQHPALGIVLLRLIQQPFEVADIAVDRGAKVLIAIVTAADLVERCPTVEAIEVTAEYA